jgi:hypothetical protein
MAVYNLEATAQRKLQRAYACAFLSICLFDLNRQVLHFFKLSTRTRNPSLPPITH